MTSHNANKDQIAYWNGDMGQRWLSVEDQLDELFEIPLTELLRVASAKSGDRVLDVGCGSGVSTFAVARQVVPAGEVVGVDVSRPMVERAKQHLENVGLGNVTFLEADAQLHAFEDNLFDLIISRFGVMFFDDPVAAFQNLNLALKPGGRMAIMAWAGINDNNPWFSVPRDVAVAKLGPPAPTDPYAPSPFAFAEIDRVEGILRDAGFNDCCGARSELMLTFDRGIESYAEMIAKVGPAARLIKEYDAGPDITAEIQRDIASEIVQFASGDTVRISATVNVFTATA